MRTIIFMLAAMLLVACDGAKEVAEQSVTEPLETNQGKQAVASAEHAKISWYEGSVEEAFAQASAEDQPLFLYWGAVWCPPCQEIKSTVFKSQAFINLSKLFIPVYLDGDTEQAQAWGEKFGVMGYPTMIVFNKTGDEVTRIPGGIDIDKYNSVLELSLNQMKPTAELIQLVLNDSDELTDDDYYQLAYYSWGQDTGAVPEGTDKVDLFARLADKAPAGELSSRFYLEYLLTVARKIKKEEVAADTVNSEAVVSRLKEILSNRALALACFDTLAYYPDDILEMPIYTDADKALLEPLWSDAIFDLRGDKSLSKAEQMGGWMPKLYLATRDDAVLPEADQVLLRTEMTAVDKTTPDNYERQSVINQMSYIYREAGLNGDARALLLAELDKSAAPYYFMSSLSSMAEKEGDFDAALDWRKQAWESATGQATRFQWGAGYVRALVRMTPQHVEIIAASSGALLDEFPEARELFAGRNFRILRRLNKQLLAWQEEQEVADAAFSPRVESLCQDLIGDSMEAENCKSLFVEEAIAEAS